MGAEHCWTRFCDRCDVLFLDAVCAIRAGADTRTMVYDFDDWSAGTGVMLVGFHGSLSSNRDQHLQFLQPRCHLRIVFVLDLVGVFNILIGLHELRVLLRKAETVLLDSKFLFAASEISDRDVDSHLGWIGVVAGSLS